ncbi:MAG: BatD family protein [Candidatus Omnitrophica bacterium]|nr:BatD family protein [Candidatus Omnitrophota bacterium]
MPFLALVFVLFFNLHIGNGFVYAAEPEVSMAIDKESILLGDSVILTITVRGGDFLEPPEIASTPDFDVRFRGARQESYSSFTMIVQGRTVEQKQTGGGYNFDYVLTPRRAGTLQVPPFPITINQRTYQTRPFTIQVYDRSEKSEDIFVEVFAAKHEVYLGEKVLVTVKWYFNKDVDSYLMNVPWLDGLKNFLITDPEPEENKRYYRFTVNGNTQVLATKEREFYKGQPYTVIAFQKLLTPLAVGTYTLDPIFLRADVVTGYQRQRSRSIFDDFFENSLDSFFGFGGSAITEPFSTRSDPLVITVREVPMAEKPDSFSGGVGVFDFRVSVKPLRLKVGEPITFTMQVVGAGNIEQVKMPAFPKLEDFKTYEPESRVNTAQKEGEIIGEKIFEMVLVPKKEGRFEIPPIRFTYFNPRQQGYQTIQRGPYSVVVEKGEVEEEI